MSPVAVDAVTFQTLLTSRRRMERADRRDLRLRGLRDIDTGEVFVIEEDRLLHRGWTLPQSRL